MRVNPVRVVVFFGLLVALVLSAIFLKGGSETVKAGTASGPKALSARYSDFAVADETTKVIRDARTRFVQVETPTSVERDAAAKMGHIVSDHGSFVIVAATKRTARELGAGQTLLETNISFPGASFDPVLKPVRESLDQQRSGGYYVIQLGTVATDEVLDSLRDAGVEILQYIPNQAFLVHADSDAMTRAAGHSRVRWTGEYLPEYKIPRDIVAKSESGQTDKFEMVEKDRALFDVAVWSRADLDNVHSQLAAVSGAEVVVDSKLPNNYFNIVRVSVPLSSVASLAQIPDVITANPYFTPRAEDERSSQIISGNFTSTTLLNPAPYDPLTQFGVDGTNVTVGMIDDGVAIPGTGGFYITANNTLNGPLRGGATGASGGHGHLNASIVAGDLPAGGLDALGYNMGRGVAPKSHIVNIPFLNGYTGTDANMVDDSVITAGVNGVKTYVINNSWGSGAGGAGNPYTTRAASFDGFVRDASSAATVDPLVIVFSAGNQGTAGMTDPKSAKNIITTAASENIRPEISTTGADNLDDLGSYSSRGPATDGRIKPDITAPGSTIAGSRGGNGTSVSGQVDANHSYSIGTSHAAPQVTGAAALFTQFWKNGHAGVNPSVSLVKAAIISSGQEMAGANVATTIPNGNEGWGRLNMKFMFNTGVTMTHVNENAILASPGDTRLYSGTIGDNTKPVRVTLVWTDPPGAANANPALVNNLDLTVTAGGNTYRGNVFTSGLSATGGSADNRNNVENVWLPAGVSGPISITVGATALNGDGVLGNADTTDQHYSLVVYNGSVTEAIAPLVVSGGNPAVTAENRFPQNGVPDPGETLTVNLPLQNAGTGATTNLVATLQATGGVTSPSGPQNYGALAPGGSDTRPFTFTANGNCGDNITLTLSLQDGAASLGNVTYTMKLGTTVTSTLLTQNWDGVVAPNLPAGWTAVTAAGSPAWVTSTTTPDTAPNTTFVNDPGTVSDRSLVSPPFTPGAAGATVSFRNNFNTEAGWDGAVLEISINGGPFADIVTAGGSFTAGGYNGTLGNDSSCVSAGTVNPLATRSAWTGNSAGYITSTAVLPAIANGQNVQLRWRMGSDCSVTGTGWRVDAVTISSSSPSCAVVTAGEVEVSGRVQTPDGAAIPKAKVMLTDNTGFTRTTTTNRAGNFTLTGVESGRTYVVSIGVRGYTFGPQIIEVHDNVTGLIFTSDN